MIADAVISVFVWIIKAVVGLLPTGAAPAWLDDGAGYMAEIFGLVSGLGAWVPVSLAVTVVAAVLACVVIGFLIKVIRIVASFLTAGGGSAA